MNKELTTAIDCLTWLIEWDGTPEILKKFYQCHKDVVEKHHIKHIKEKENENGMDKTRV